MSLFELAKGYTLPLGEDSSMLEAPREIIEAYNVLKAKCKLHLILRSKAVKTPSTSVGDLVHVLVKLSHQERDDGLVLRKFHLWTWNHNLLSIPESVER